MAAHKLDYFLGSSPNLHALQLAAQKLARAQQAWEKIAPPALIAAACVGALQQGALTIYVNNGAIAAKLKQQAQSLLAKLRESGLEVTSIRFEVQVRVAENSAKHEKEIALSAGALNSLEHLADVLEDSPLREALRRLVKHHQA